MPNHFHAIMEIVGATLVVARNIILKNHLDTGLNKNVIQANESVSVVNQILEQSQGVAPTNNTKTVGDIVGAFQSIVTVAYIRGVKQFDWKSFNGKLWQRNYYEDVIRNELSYRRISNYIINNPDNWKNDKFADINFSTKKR